MESYGQNTKSLAEFLTDKTLLQVPSSEEKRRRFSKSGANSDSNIHKRVQQGHGNPEKNLGKIGAKNRNVKTPEPFQNFEFPGLS